MSTGLFDVAVAPAIRGYQVGKVWLPKEEVFELHLTGEDEELTLQDLTSEVEKLDEGQPGWTESQLGVVRVRTFKSGAVLSELVVAEGPKPDHSDEVPLSPYLTRAFTGIDLVACRVSDRYRVQMLFEKLSPYIPRGYVAVREDHLGDWIIIGQEKAEALELSTESFLMSSVGNWCPVCPPPKPEFQKQPAKTRAKPRQEKSRPGKKSRPSKHRHKDQPTKKQPVENAPTPTAKSKQEPQPSPAPEQKGQPSPEPAPVESRDRWFEIDLSNLPAMIIVFVFLVAVIVTALLLLDLLRPSTPPPVQRRLDEIERRIDDLEEDRGPAPSD